VLSVAVRRRLRVGLLAGLLTIGPARLAAAADDAPRWFEAGRPTAAAQQAVARLLDARSHGLDPADYAAEPLQQALARAQQAPPAADAAAALDRALTEASQRWLNDLHAGRIDPRRVDQHFEPARRADFDAAAVLRAAVQAGDLAPAERAAAPALPPYEQLRAALARHRALADDPAWREPLPPLPAARRGAPKLEPGQGWAGLPTLRQRLAALGDLPAGTPAAPVYDAALVAGVEAFQRRHGLRPDGVVGAATLAQLQVGPAARARQIELMLERLRWTPLLQAPRMVVVNIPEFVLRAYEVTDGRIAVQREMKVIVGRAFDTRTPVFDEDMRYVEFAPYWNVPPSIARGELVPKLRRDPAAFDREGYEFVAGDGRVQATLTPQALEAVLAGQWRIRQRPGERNALGDIKFVFPNRDNIYLHHTPSVRLFERERRDFSHGCIRVEQPVALATFVLQGLPEWTEARIREAMAAGQPRTVRLAQPLPVLIAYGTALVKGGQTFFFDDIYGLDRALDAALRNRPPRPPIIVP
jgi:murein L,D-transpeptidase YcbB/YkuD